MNNNEKKTCWNCAYRRNIPGNAHIRCAWNWTGRLMPQGKLHGIRNGWYHFPFCYDPTWMIDECPNFATELDESKVRESNPIADIIAALL